jgi:hypothetical protein
MPAGGLPMIYANGIVNGASFRYLPETGTLLLQALLPHFLDRIWQKTPQV